MTVDFNLLLGTASIIYGLYTLIVRHFTPEKFPKLQSMKENYGDQMGMSIHIVGYTVGPVVAGLLMLFAHFRG